MKHPGYRFATAQPVCNAGSHALLHGGGVPRHIFQRAFFMLMLLVSIAGTVQAQEVLPLYTGAIPNSKAHSLTENPSLPANGMYNLVTNPTLEVYLPAKSNASGAAVIICPGGGYSVIVYNGEGVNTAKELANNGITAFVLKYRLPHDSTMVNKAIGPLQDVQQAFKLVRENAARWNVDVNKVGIMGFSAGGHLAATGATHFAQAYIPNTNGTNLRPDFQVLVYPVISMADSLTHNGSRVKLLGNKPSAKDVEMFSNERQVTNNTPPAYITHAADDVTVDVDNSIAYFEALRHQKVPVEMHIYPKGGHGFVFRHKGWMEPLVQWMKNSKWILDKVQP